MNIVYNSNTIFDEVPVTRSTCSFRARVKLLILSELAVTIVSSLSRIRELRFTRSNSRVDVRKLFEENDNHFQQ